MILKGALLLILLLSLFTYSNGQNKLADSHINNESVKYELIWAQPDWDKDEKYSKLVVQVKAVDSVHWEIIKSIKKDEWINLLSDEKYDWAADLLLYQLHRKMGSIFKVAKTRADWINKYKKEDLAFWAEYLK